MAKQKNCTKGHQCGASCISRTKKCLKTEPAESAGKLDKLSGLLGSASGARKKRTFETELATAREKLLKRNRKLTLKATYEIDSKLDEKFNSGSEDYLDDLAMISVDKDFIGVSYASENFKKSSEINIDLDPKTKAWNLTLAEEEDVYDEETGTTAFKTDYAAPYTDNELKDFYSKQVDEILETLPDNMQFSFNTNLYKKFGEEQQEAMLDFWKSKGFEMNKDGHMIKP